MNKNSRIIRLLRKLNLYYAVVCGILSFNLSDSMRILDYMKEEGLR